jgi:uncharacterized protein (TIGR02646 family)
MIKLTAKPAPAELTPEIVKELTEKYKQNKKLSVWQDKRIHPFIKEKLLSLSNNKCCYCECEINGDGSDLHIEHFYPASIYEDKVLEWDNLLPSCFRCNRHKSTLDTKEYPIIHPVINNPKEHLIFEAHLLLIKGKDELGSFTVERLGLSDDERLLVGRYKLGVGVNKQLKELNEKLNDKLQGKAKLTITQETKFINELRGIMQLGTSERKYSAVISSLILINGYYKTLKNIFDNQNLWTDEFIELEQQMQYCALI